MSRTAVFVCLAPRGSEWQLGALPPAAGRVLLIGWAEDPPPVDAGVPEGVATVLARALTSFGRVTFPTAVVQASAGHSWSPFTRAPGPVELLWTRNPQAVLQAFDDASHPWWMQGQVLLVSEPAAAVAPEIDRKQLAALLEDKWTMAADALSAAGVISVLRPGVDGDVAGLWTATEETEHTSLAALEGEARRASFDWAVLSEEAFAERYRS